MNSPLRFRSSRILSGTFSLLLLVLATTPARAQGSFEVHYDSPGNPSNFIVATAHKGVAEIKYCGTDGGYIMAGRYTDLASPDDRAYVVRTRNDGSMVWAWTYDFGSPLDVAYSIREVPDGTGFIVVGTTQVTPNGDIFLMRLDCDGRVIWVQSYASQTNPQEMGFDVIVAQSVNPGNPYDFVVAGSISDPLNQTIDGYLMRTDASGAVLWTGGYDFNMAGSTISNEWLNGLTEAAPTMTVGSTMQSVGDIIAVGGYANISQNQIDGYIIRVDGATGLIHLPGNPASNNLQNQAVYGTNDVEEFHSVIELKEAPETGNIAAIGLSGNMDPSGDIYMIKTTGNPGSNLVQSVIASSATGIHDIGRDLVEAAGDYERLGEGVFRGDLVITGATSEPAGGVVNDAILLGVDVTTLNHIPNSGRVYGDHRASDKEEGISITEVIPYGTNVQGFAVAGIGAPTQDAYLVKTDANGATGCEERWEPRSTNPQWPNDQALTPPSFHSPAVTSQTATLNKGEGWSLCDVNGKGINKPSSQTDREEIAETQEATGELLPLPNPVRRGNDISLFLANTEWKNPTATITAINGEEVQKVSNLEKGSSGEIRLKTDRLHAGTYIVKLSDGTRTCSARIVVQ